MKSLITNIQRFSLTDGPGIRTTVFFQGCNMHCAWCHNPETLPMKPVLMHYENKCIGCGTCFKVCPQHAHLISNGKHLIDRELCRACGKCAEMCYADALVMSSRYYTVEDVMNEILQDRLYYQESSGGVTLSGGEAGLHSSFAMELAERCHAEGIHIAVETNMSLPFSEISGMLKKMDLIMCDLKIFDDALHKKWTGIGNSQIKENIEKASQFGIPLIIRTPLIPEATDSIDNINEILDFLSGLDNIYRYELLNFNPLGDGKYTALDWNNPFSDASPFSRSNLNELRQKLSVGNIELKII